MGYNLSVTVTVCLLANGYLPTRKQEEIEGEAMMKRARVILGMLLVAVFLAGCATTGAGNAVKCPACGYEFNVPNDPEP